MRTGDGYTRCSSGDGNRSHQVAESLRIQPHNMGNLRWGTLGGKRLEHDIAVQVSPLPVSRIASDLARTGGNRRDQLVHFLFREAVTVSLQTSLSLPAEEVVALITLRNALRLCHDARVAPELPERQGA